MPAGDPEAAVKRPKKVEWDPKKEERMAAMEGRSCLWVSEVHPRKNGGLGQLA